MAHSTVHSPPLRALVTGGSTVGRLDAVRYTECLTLTGEAEPCPLGHRLLLDSQNPFRGTLGLRIAATPSHHQQGEDQRLRGPAWRLACSAACLFRVFPSGRSQELAKTTQKRLGVGSHGGLLRRLNLHEPLPPQECRQQHLLCGKAALSAAPDTTFQLKKKTSLSPNQMGVTGIPSQCR